MPSSSTTAASSDAPEPSSTLSARSYVGHSTMTLWPRANRFARSQSPCSEPFVSSTRPGCTPNQFAISARSGVYPAEGPYGEERPAVALEHGARAVGELVLGDALGSRNAAREGDRVHCVRV